MNTATSSVQSEVDSGIPLPPAQYPASELVQDSSGRVYHLALPADSLARKVILVGDPGRVDLVASFFDEVLSSSQHREFTAKSGFYQGKYITVMSTGIGTDNIDITLNELDACVNIDLEKREDAQSFTSLEIVRIGTCGILQKDIPLFSYIVSSYAYGFDNVAHFYCTPRESEASQLVQQALDEHIRDVFPMEFVKPYVSTPDEEMRQKFLGHETVTGITITSSGFYGPQGRSLRLNTKTKQLNEKLMSFHFSCPSGTDDVACKQQLNNIRVTNYEMETSALYSLGKGMGHRCITICLGIANRAAGKFATDDELACNMSALVRYVLDRI